MGDQKIHQKAAQSQGVMSTYTVMAFSAHDLPKEYFPLIYSAWVKSLRHGNDFFKLIDPAAYYPVYRTHVENTLRRVNSMVRLAVITEDRDVVLGFSVSHGNVLDYVYVQKDQRRMGIGANLVPHGIETISHLTKTGLNIWGNKYGQWKFNPFA